MDIGERSGEPGRSARTGSNNNNNNNNGSGKGTASLSALFRHVLRSPFAQDSRGGSGPLDANGFDTTASIDTTTAAYSTPAPGKASHTAANPTVPEQQQQQQPTPESPESQAERSDRHSTHAVASSFGLHGAGVRSDAVLLAHSQAGLLDRSAHLVDRLEALQGLAFELSNSRATNIGELWYLLNDIVEFAFDDNNTDKGLGMRARIIVLALIASIAKSDPQDPDFGGDAKKTRKEMLSVIAKAEGWDETVLAVQCAGWASDNAHCLTNSPSNWFERAQRWVKMTAHAQYPETSDNDSPKAETVAAQDALTASLAFLSSIVEVEYPVLDSSAVSGAATWLCGHGAQPRLVDKDGIEAVSWAWTEPEHLKGVLQFLKTVITYGAISQDVLLPGIMLLCTTVASIPACKGLCCEIIRILFTSCYMRDTLLSMNRILHQGNT
ncbi:hypothetical protein LPJ59_003408, partial [Coemansia sp. RSA 2399]